VKRLSIDWLVVSVTLVLAVVGILIVRSAEQGSGGAPGLWTRQALWVAFGVAAMMVVASLPPRVLQTFAWPLYLLAVGLLLLVLPLGHLAGGARRWFTVRGLNVQPSELAKVATIVLVSHLLPARRARGRPAKQIGLALAAATPPFLLVAAEPDLATSMVFVSLSLAMTWWAGVSPVTLFCLVAPVLSMACAFSAVSWGVFLLVTLAILVLSRTSFRRAAAVVLLSLATGAATPLAWNALEDYQKERLLTFVDPSRDPKGAGWNTIQSKIALGSGGTWGKGYFKGTQKKLAFLPARHTDFVFSVVGEESGAVGGIIVLCLYLTLCGRLLSLASRTRDEHAALVAFGVAVMLAFHVMVNVAMVTGLFPVAGLPLPLLSYGGSFTGTTFLGIGLALQAAARRTRR
jgi:rod shape determining protein RodA